MSSEVICGLEGEDLLKENKELNEMLTLMEKFRVLLISMVNNCKCNTETNIRIKFNLLMEEYHHLNHVRHESTPTEQTSFGDETRKQTLFDSMTKTEDGRDLDLRERIVRLKRFVARPKTYAKRAPKCDTNADHTFACVWPQCHKQFKAKVDMKTHLWRHTGDKQYVCEWPGCGKRFPIKRNLTRHRETHEGTKAFACDWPGCDYKSWYPQGVRAHKKRHTDERPYKCRHCEWTFRQSHHLKAHTLKHTGEKPFGCEHEGCVQRFQSRQAMKFHFQRTHKSKDETVG